MSLIKRIGRNLKNHYNNKGIRGIFELILGVIILKFPWIFLNIGCKNVHCPICKWEGKRFLPFRSGNYVSFNVRCPKCHSTPYHRGHYYFYTKIWNFESKQGKLLFIAPEPGIHTLILTNPNLDIKTADLFKEGVDYKFDLIDISLDDLSFDYIICHRVIEHTSDDIKAMNELLRILKPKGELIFSVPIDLTMENTIKFDVPNPLENYHYYRYGTDFDTRIPKGFDVEKHKIIDIVPEDMVEKLHINSSGILFHAIKNDK